LEYIRARGNWLEIPQMTSLLERDIKGFLRYMSKDEELAKTRDRLDGRRNEGGGIKSLTASKGGIKMENRKQKIDRLSAMNIMELVLNDKNIDLTICLSLLKFFKKEVGICGLMLKMLNISIVRNASKCF
jgi:hypothetical protein